MRTRSLVAIRSRARAVAFALGALQSIALSANPFLPSHEYIPDGEPRVFGDRLYLYGSHDKAGSDRFCDHILKVWSAPLNDLNTWTDHGIMLSTRDVDGHKRDYTFSDYEFYAPACVEVKGKYYYFAQVVGAPCVVAVGDTPTGPFKIISKINAPAGAPADFGGWSQYFDPGVLVDDDGKVYLYWGGGSSHMAQLDPKTMVDILPGTYQENILPKGEPFNYQEGPSPHKINGLYYIVYARGEDLAYATSKSPTGPFDYRGVIVSHKVDANSGNIHGGIARLNGQWHVFYHRQTNQTVFSRRACTERINIEADGSIKLVEQTSLGFETSLNPYQFTPADIACVFRGGSYVTELDKVTHSVKGNRNGCVVGYKYFDFGDTILSSQSTLFTLQFRDAEISGQVEVWLGDPEGGGEKLGTVPVKGEKPAEGAWRETSVPVRNLSGLHGVYFKFISETNDKPIADIRSFAFTRDTR